jgi:alpha-mannosidase
MSSERIRQEPRKSHALQGDVSHIEKPTFHMIGHGHIDVQWLWGRQEALDEARSTFRSALDRMNEFPDFKFTASTSLYYEYIKDVDPNMFHEIQQRVEKKKMGYSRWEKS